MRPSMPTRNRASRRSVRREPADWRPAMKTRPGPGRFSATPIGKKPPSSATSRGRRARRSSSAAVVGSRSGSLGEPICVAAGRMRPRRPRDEAPLARRRGSDDHATDLVDHFGPQSPHELAHRRLIRDAFDERDLTEPAQMQRVRNLAHQRLIAPPRALLDDHQPDEHRHRDRRPATSTRGLSPRPLDRLQQRRVARQPVQRREIRRQLAHLDRQPQIEQRLHLPTRQPKHLPSKSPDLQGRYSPSARTEPPTISGASS
jgi:hypothetical protein